MASPVRNNWALFLNSEMVVAAVARLRKSHALASVATVWNHSLARRSICDSDSKRQSSLTFPESLLMECDNT